MLQKILLAIAIVHGHSICSVSHTDLWSCALKKNTCMNKFQLHRTTTLKSGKTSWKRPFIMAIEGPKYQRLFDDCDVDHNGCISMEDIEHAGTKCQRSCIWRTTMHNMLC